jgi:hypothetical protein
VSDLNGKRDCWISSNDQSLLQESESANDEVNPLYLAFRNSYHMPETKTAQVEFCEELADIVNTQFLVTTSNPSQWVVHVADKAKKDVDDTGRIKIGDLRLQGPQVRKFMKIIELVIRHCIPVERKILTLSAVQHYINAEDILSQHHDYADDNI